MSDYQPPLGREGTPVTPTVVQPGTNDSVVLNPLSPSTINSSPITSQPITVPVNGNAPFQPPVQPLPTSGYAPQVNPNQTYTPHQWSTPLFDCLRDEESCWWSFWCCWVISARNTAEFQLGSAKKQIAWCIGIFIIAWLLIVLRLGPLGPLLLIGAAVYYVYYRTNNRQQMKSLLHILSGEWMSDFLLHCCCTCCTIAQESRESSRAPRNKRLDYCSEQELSELAPNADNLFEDPEIPSATPSTATAPGISLLNFRSEQLHSIYFKLSQTSQNILISLGVFFLLIMFLILLSNPLAFVVLLLVFVQPILVLYLIYWRTRRKFAQLDYVIKLFCVGFFLSTTQSVFFENILQQILTFLAILLFFLIHGGKGLSDDSQLVPSDDGSSTQWFSSSHPLASLLRQIVPQRGAFFYQSQYESLSPMLHPWYQSLSHLSQQADYSSFSSASSGGAVGSSWSFSLQGSTPTFSPTLAPSSATDLNNLSRELIRDNIFLVLFVLFLMAFVVAAGVEETMKHFAVRCCRFPTVLKDPNVILVYLVSAALGFATAENIEYVFGVHQSPIPGTSRFVGELVILAMRLLMPIHLICAVIQAANLSRVVLGIASHWNLLRVLLSAVVLHGSFDYLLFALGAIQFAYEIDSIAMDILSIVLPILITIGGVIFAYRSYTEVEKRFQDNWRTISTQDDETGNSML